MSVKVVEVTECWSLTVLDGDTGRDALWTLSSVTR